MANRFNSLTENLVPFKVDVIVAENVEKANWFVLSMRAIGGFFGDVWGSVASTVKGWF